VRITAVKVSWHNIVYRD